MMLDEERTDIAKRLGLNITLDEFPEACATVVVRAARFAWALPKSPNCIVSSSFFASAACAEGLRILTTPDGPRQAQH